MDEALGILTKLNAYLPFEARRIGAVILAFG
jgi:hypothetical protein